MNTQVRVVVRENAYSIRLIHHRHHAMVRFLLSSLFRSLRVCVNFFREHTERKKFPLCCTYGSLLSFVSLLIFFSLGVVGLDNHQCLG